MISLKKVIQLGFLISLFFSVAVQAQDKSRSLKSYLEGNWGGPGCIHPTSTVVAIRQKETFIDNIFEIDINPDRKFSKFMSSYRSRFGSNELVPPPPVRNKYDAKPYDAEVIKAIEIEDEKDSSKLLGAIITIKVGQPKETVQIVINYSLDFMAFGNGIYFKCQKQNDVSFYRDKQIELVKESKFSIKDFRLNTASQDKCKAYVYQTISPDNSLFEWCTFETTIFEIPFRGLITSKNGKTTYITFINAKNDVSNLEDYYSAGYKVGDQLVTDPFSLGNSIAEKMTQMLGPPTETKKVSQRFEETIRKSIGKSDQAIDRALGKFKEKCGECNLKQTSFIWKDGDTSVTYSVLIPETKGSLGIFSTFAIGYGSETFHDSLKGDLNVIYMAKENDARVQIEKINNIAKGIKGKDF